MTFHCAWKRNGQELVEDPGDERAPDAEDAADQGGRGQRQRVLRLEVDRARDAVQRREQAAGDTGQERGQREGPELVEGDVHACGDRSRLALADRCPRATGFGRDVEQGDDEEDRGDDDDVAVVGGVAHRHLRPPDVREPRQVRARRMAGEAAAAVREVDHRQHHGRGGGEHQRDQREVEAGEANCRQADEHADRHHDRSVDDQQQRERDRGRVREARADPAADREQSDLTEGDHPDPSVEQAEAERGDRVDGHARERRDPVGAGDRRQHQERYEEQDRRGDQAARALPVDDGRAGPRRAAPSVPVRQSRSSRWSAKG